MTTSLISTKKRKITSKKSQVVPSNYHLEEKSYVPMIVFDGEITWGAWCETKEEAEFHGKYYDFPPVKMYPKPLQKPHPPILIGGMAKRVFNRIVEVGDGWLPNRVTPEEVQNGKSKIRSLCAESGRNPDDISITIYGQSPDKQLITDFINAGADRVVVSPKYYETVEEMTNELESIAQSVL